MLIEEIRTVGNNRYLFGIDKVVVLRCVSYNGCNECKWYDSRYDLCLKEEDVKDVNELKELLKDMKEKMELIEELIKKLEK